MIPCGRSSVKECARHLQPIDKEDEKDTCLSQAGPEGEKLNICKLLHINQKTLILSYRKMGKNTCNFQKRKPEEPISTQKRLQSPSD